MKKLWTLIALLFLLTGIKAQDDAGVTPAPDSPKGGSQKFLLTGAGSAMFTASKDANTFMPMTLMLMPMTKINDRLFLESGVKIEYGGGPDFEWGVEVINLHYRITPWLTAHFGKFAAPWGNVLDMFGEGFVSRFPTTPIGLSDDGMAPTDQVGFGFQGGIQTGSAKMLYDIYVANGPQLIVDNTDTTADNMNGHMSYDGLMDNNKNKSIGGKIGILPFSNSSLQIDVFAQTAAKTGAAGTPYENVSSTSYGADFNFYKTINPILLRLRGQYEATQTSSASYIEGNTTYTFDNKGNSWYLSGTLRPTGASNKIINSLEFGTRFVKYTPPKKALWGGDPQTQLTFDLTYWFTWSTQINFGYDIQTVDGASTNAFVIRSVYKF